jgi:hypothetical protein
MKIVLNDVDYPIKPLTIEQYLAIKDNPNIGEVELIALMINVPVDLIRKAPMAEVKFVAKMLMSELSNLDNTSPLVLDLYFKGNKYGLLRPSRMTYEEWINMEVFMAQKPVNLLKLATHLYRPLDGENYGEQRKLIAYDLAECEAREDEFRSFPVDIILSALFFLTTFVRTLMEDSQSSSPKKKTPDLNERMKNLLPKK